MHTGVVMGMFIMLLVTLVLWSRGPIEAFKPWFEWFDQWDPDKKYRCLTPTLMAYFYGPVFMFDVAKLASIEGAVPQDWYIDFIMSVMRTYGRGVIPGNEDSSVMVPRNICQSLAPDSSDLPAAVDTLNAVKFVKGHSVNINGQDHYMSEDRVKQWPRTAEDWRVLMCDSHNGGWGCNFSDDKWTGDSNIWENSPTNFLWKFYAIPYDSVLIKGFVTNDESFEGRVLFPDALEPLLGVSVNQNEGGWLGFLKGGDRWGDFNSLMVQSYVWSDALSPKRPATDPCSNLFQCAASGISFGLMTGPLFWKLFAKTKWGIVWTGFCGLISAATGGALGAASQGCFQ